jgi:hypothetical protein
MAGMSAFSDLGVTDRLIHEKPSAAGRIIRNASESLSGDQFDIHKISSVCM